MFGRTKKPKKRRRLRRLLLLGGLASGLAAWRNRQVAVNERQYGAR